MKESERTQEREREEEWKEKKEKRKKEPADLITTLIIFKRFSVSLSPFFLLVFQC